MCEDEFHTTVTNLLWKGSRAHTRATYTGAFHQKNTQSQMCCNVMLRVINIVVRLTAPTDWGNKSYTHTDIRVVYNVFFGLTTKIEASFKEKEKYINK